MLQPSDILPRTLDLRFLTSPTITTNASARNLALDRGARTRALRNVRAERFCVTCEVPHSVAFPSDDPARACTQRDGRATSAARCMPYAEHSVCRNVACRLQNTTGEVPHFRDSATRSLMKERKFSFLSGPHGAELQLGGYARGVLACC